VTTLVAAPETSKVDDIAAAHEHLRFPELLRLFREGPRRQWLRAPPAKKLGVSFELWSTVAAVGTFVVIAATAIAAFVQLRQIRRSNQLAGLQSTFAMLLDPTVRELLNYVRHGLAERMNDENFCAGLRKIPVDRREHPELYLCDLYNHVGSFVRNGLIDEEVYLQTEWYNVNLYWSLLRDAIAEVRANRPYVFENFEWLAARARRWRDEHPRGDYPPNERRMIDGLSKMQAD
jgi:hypothetical protein